MSVIQTFHQILRNKNLKKVNVICLKKKKVFYLQFYIVQRGISTLLLEKFWSGLYETAKYIRICRSLILHFPISVS